MRLEGILCFSLFRLSFSLYSGFLGIELKRSHFLDIFYVHLFYSHRIIQSMFLFDWLNQNFDMNLNRTYQM